VWLQGPVKTTTSPRNVGSIVNKAFKGSGPVATLSDEENDYTGFGVTTATFNGKSYFAGERARSRGGRGRPVGRARARARAQGGRWWSEGGKAPSRGGAPRGRRAGPSQAVPPPRNLPPAVMVYNYYNGFVASKKAHQVGEYELIRGG
jgi:hypothetical protein